MHTACAATKQAIAPKVCQIVLKICREKNVWHPKIRKTPQISRNFSRQGYASDFRLRQSFLTTSAQLAGDGQYPQQVSPFCVVFVLLGVRGTYVYVLLGPICGKTMSQSWQAYLTNHSCVWTRPGNFRFHACLLVAVRRRCQKSRTCIHPNGGHGAEHRMVRCELAARDSP